MIRDVVLTTMEKRKTGMERVFNPSSLLKKKGFLEVRWFPGD